MMPAPTSKALFSTCLPTPGWGACRGLRPGHEGAGQRARALTGDLRVTIYGYFGYEYPSTSAPERLFASLLSKTAQELLFHWGFSPALSEKPL